MVVGILMKVVVPKFKIVQKLTDKINEVTRENLTGIRVVRAFNAEDYQENKFEDTNTKLTNQQLFNGDVNGDGFVDVLDAAEIQKKAADIA